MCFKISVFAANMNLFPHADKAILKKKLRKPSQSYCNSNKIWAHITACNYWVREGAEFTLSQLLICLWRFSYSDNLMLYYNSYNKHISRKIESLHCISKIMKVSTVAGNSIPPLSHVNMKLTLCSITHWCT